MKQFDIIYSYDIKYKYNMMHLVIILTDVSTYFWASASGASIVALYSLIDPSELKKAPTISVPLDPPPKWVYA